MHAGHKHTASIRRNENTTTLRTPQTTLHHKSDKKHNIHHTHYTNTLPDSRNKLHSTTVDTQTNISTNPDSITEQDINTNITTIHTNITTIHTTIVTNTSPKRQNNKILHTTTTTYKHHRRNTH